MADPNWMTDHHRRLRDFVTAAIVKHAEAQPSCWWETDEEWANHLDITWDSAYLFSLCQLPIVRACAQQATIEYSGRTQRTTWGLMEALKAERDGHD